MSACPTCPEATGETQHLLLPAVNPDLGSPAAAPFDACPPNVTDSPLACHDGYRLPLTARVATASAEPCKTFEITVACADQWAYPGLLIELHPYGFAQVTAVDGHVLSVQNLNIAANTPIPPGTAIRPIPRAPLDQNGFSVSDDELQDADQGNLSQSVAFPIFEKVAACGASSEEQRFAMRARNRMCGIPLTSGANVSGIRLGLYVPTTGCFHFLPNGAEGTSLRIVNGSPRWVADATSKIFLPTGEEQILTVPSGFTKMLVKCWGSNGAMDEPYAGGGGGYTEGYLDVSAGQRYRVIVGKIALNNYGTVGQASPAGYGFGGAGRNSGTSNAQGGGLSGIFTDGSPITAADAARALLVAGGGSGSHSINQVGGSGAIGSPGNDNAANEGSMQGATAANTSDGNGAGGGGWKGGGLNQGGRGYAAPSVSNPVITMGSGSTKANMGDGDFQGGIEGLVVVKFLW